jgi:hypothetical protein
MTQLEPVAKTQLEPLAKFRHDVYSQNGEDGIIREVLSRISRRHELSQWCVEFGAWNGVFLSNTCRLIREDGYRAVLIEPVPKRFAELCENFPDDKVVKLQSFVEASGENSLDSLLDAAGCSPDVDLVSIDIDGCDYHIFESLRVFRPKIVCVEYNGTIPNEVDFAQPLDFGVKWGSSAAAMCRVGDDKGYVPVAVTATNVILVRNDLADLVISPESATLAVLRDDADARNFIFSGYDGTVLTTGPVRLPWHQYTAPSRSLQVLPRSLRKFSGDYRRAEQAAFLTFVAMRSPSQLPSFAQLRSRWVNRSRTR